MVAFVTDDNDNAGSDIFDLATRDILCKVITRSFPAIGDSLYLEVNLRPDNGRALDNGLFNCTPEGGKRNKEPEVKPFGSGRAPNTDYIIALHPPLSGGRSTILVGDYKIRPKSIKTLKPQFKAIMSHSRNHGSYVVLYITLYGGNVDIHQRSLGLARGVRFFIVQLLG